MIVNQKNDNINEMCLNTNNSKKKKLTLKNQLFYTFLLIIHTCNYKNC